MRNKVLLLLTTFFFAVGCSNTAGQESLEGEYINSKKYTLITYDKNSFEEYLNMAENKKQESLKSLSTNFQHLDGVKEISVGTNDNKSRTISITDNDFVIEWSNGERETAIPLEDKFFKSEVKDVYKVKRVNSFVGDKKEEQGEFNIYYVLNDNGLSIINEDENAISISLFYKKGSDNYDRMVKEQESIEKVVKDQKIAGDYVTINEGLGVPLEATELKNIIDKGEITDIAEILSNILANNNKEYSTVPLEVGGNLNNITIDEKENLIITLNNEEIVLSPSAISKNGLRIYDLRKEIEAIIVFKENVLVQVSLTAENPSLYLAMRLFYKEDSEEYKQALKQQEERKKAEAESVAKAKAESESIEKAKAESESIVRAKAESESKAEAERQKAEEERKKNFSPDNYAVLEYENAMRNEKDWAFKAVQISGKVLQVQNGDDTVHYRIGTQDNGYEGVFLVEISKNSLENRVLEDDWVTVYGYYFGVAEYTTVMNAKREIPIILAEKITID